jgi:arginine utilization regulatory protein
MKKQEFSAQRRIGYWTHDKRMTGVTTKNGTEGCIMKKKTETISYVDSMMVVDKNLNVIHTNRFNPRYDREKMKNEYADYHDKKYYEVYPDLVPEESTMINCLKTGSIIYMDKQSFSDFKGGKYTTRNITYPIIRYGEIVGAIELSQDITALSDYSDESSRTDPKTPRLSKITQIQDKPPSGFTFDNIITSNESMKESVRQAKIFAMNDKPVLIYGETGTGKEMFVEAMLNFNPAWKNKLIAQNCAAIPENLFESMLFGSSKGAFTGAEDKKGLFEMAHGGVLFLDELNSMPLHLQAKLLRVIQDGIIRPVGSAEVKQVNVKIIAAVNTNPSELMRSRLIREDLFYRLSNSLITLLPLRERKEDIRLYIDHFVNLFSREYKKTIQRLSPSLVEILHQYKWPGNVRELKHIIDSMINLTEEPVLTTRNLPVYFREILQAEEAATQEPKKYPAPLIQLEPLNELLEKVERTHIEKTLKATKGNISRAAELLEIPRQTLRYRMKRLQIE